MLLLIDNYDSFAHNLARYFARLGVATHVVRNDAIDPAGVRALRPAAVVLSPGPCTPGEAGASLDIVRRLHAELPILGVCLGHQVIAEALGARIVRAAVQIPRRRLRTSSRAGVVASIGMSWRARRVCAMLGRWTKTPALVASIAPGSRR